jgi:hypothetical protein
MQDVPEAGVVNWRMTTIAQNNENILYKHISFSQAIVLTLQFTGHFVGTAHIQAISTLII